jgi:hypothetical protein
LHWMILNKGKSLKNPLRFTNETIGFIIVIQIYSEWKRRKKNLE